MSEYNGNGSKKDQYLGKHFFTRFGSEFIVIDYQGSRNLTIQFIKNPNITRHTTVRKIESNTVSDPFYDSNGKESLLPISTPQDYVGAQFKMKNGYTIQIDAYHSARQLDFHFVEFPEATGVTAITDIKNGYIKCPFQPNESGGFLGIGPYNTNDLSFGIWRGVIERANNHELHNHRLEITGRTPGTYDDCIIDPEWLNFQNFARDYHVMYDTLNPNYRYQIDKDLKYPFYKNQFNGKHCYSKETCLLLPEELNKVLVIPKLYKENFTVEKHKIYKVKKEQRIKELTRYYWDLGCILPDAYIYLIFFNVDLYM